MTCPDCDGTGERLVCPDDLCRGAGRCMHGDGEVPCALCRGTGEVLCSLCRDGGEARCDCEEP
jgi:hypothetical protein